MAAAKNSKPTELTDIPLTLDQGDSVELNATKSEKLKTNSLKRFFRTARGGVSTSKKSESTEVATLSEDESTRSINLRIGSFTKTDGIPDPEPGSSAELSKSKSTTESRISLQTRLSSYWTNVFKKSSKKSTPSEVEPQNVDDPPTTDQNQSENL